MTQYSIGGWSYDAYLKKIKQETNPDLAENFKLKMGDKGFKLLSQELQVSITSLYLVSQGRKCQNAEDWRIINDWINN